MAKNTQADASPGAALARRWISELERSEQSAQKWRDRSKKIIRRYKDERPDIPDQLGDRKFAILWSNIQTLGPAVYARTPQAVVVRRHTDEDPVGRAASEVLERAINYSLDIYDFDGRMKLCRDDFLLLARGQAWIRYEPHFKDVQTEVFPQEAAEEGVSISYEDDAGTTFDPDDVQEKDGKFTVTEQRLEYEEVTCDHVAWDDFGHNAARTWDEVRFVWRRAPMTRAALVERFGKKGKQCSLDYDPKANETTSVDETPDDTKKALVYEIWDRTTRKAIWVCKGWPNDVLDERPDPLNLRDFFPCPRPLLGTCAQDSVLPLADYLFYQDQAEEVNDLTAKIGRLSECLRMVGMYSGEHQTTLANVFKSVDNDMIPVADWQALKEGGGARGIIEWVPVDMVIQTLQAAVETRRQLLEDIYQITGISDIVRGASDPNETATAQGIKAQWGSLRVRDRQKELARFARDLIRIKGEIIAEKFSPETLKVMTGVEMLDAQQKAMLQAQAQQASATGQPVPPEMQKQLMAPTWEDVMGLLRNDAMRSFRVDIEADSTIEPDELQDREQFVGAVEAFMALMTGASQVLGAYPPAAPIFGEIAKEWARKFRVSRQLEGIVDQVFGDVAQLPPAQAEQPAQPPAPDPAEGQAKVMTAQAKVMDAQTYAQQTQVDAQVSVADLQLRANQQQLDQQALARDPRPQSVS